MYVHVLVLCVPVLYLYFVVVHVEPTISDMQNKLLSFVKHGQLDSAVDLDQNCPWHFVKILIKVFKIFLV